MNAFYLGLKFSFSYFTILPVFFKKEDNLNQDQVLAFMIFFMPLIGALLTLFSIVLFQLLEPLSYLGALLSAFLYMALYGFIHTEAVIDVADAIYASHSGKDPYKIIKEPQVGAMGVLWGVAFLIIKISAIVFLLLNHLYIEFILVTISSRLNILSLIYIKTFKSSFITKIKSTFSFSYFISSIFLFTIMGSLLSLYFIPLLVISMIFSFAINNFIQKKLGFINGDTLGANLESIEIILFILIAYIFNS
jgi:adenosylcobinamide-GDP ribazoletransferase